MYDNVNIYTIFCVSDRYFRCITKDINDTVWEDSVVEFFFAPDTSLPLRYFNQEINCDGTPLMYYNLVPRKEFKKLSTEDIEKMVTAHSLPEISDPEIIKPVTWTLEYGIRLM